MDIGRNDAWTTPSARTHTTTASPAALTARAGPMGAFPLVFERLTGAPHAPETTGRSSAWTTWPVPRSIVHAAMTFPAWSMPTSCAGIAPASERSIGACHWRDGPGRHAPWSTRGSPMSCRQTTTACAASATATRGPGPTPGSISSAGGSHAPPGARERASSTCSHAGFSGAVGQTGPRSSSQTTTASPAGLSATSTSTASGGASVAGASQVGAAAAAPTRVRLATTASAIRDPVFVPSA